MNAKNLDDLEKEFLDKGVLRGGVLMFKKEDAIQFIERCKEKNYHIYGMDGFFITDKTTQPSMENSLDFDLLPEKIPDSDRYSYAIQFIKEQPYPNMYFEVVHDIS